MVLRNKIDSNETELAMALEVIGRPGVLLTGGAAVAASGFFQFTDNAVDDTEVTVDDVTIRFMIAPVSPDDVLIGATMADTVANLADKINSYPAIAVVATAASPRVNIVAKAPGSAGNGISFTSDADEVTVTPALGTLGGGAGATGQSGWLTLEPNEFDDFGGELELLARRPINPSRQRKKGAIVDLDAQGGFSQDFTNENAFELVQGFMYARARSKAFSVPIAALAAGFRVDSTSGFAVGSLILAKGFRNSDDGLKLVTLIDDDVLEVEGGLTVDANPPDDARLRVVGEQFPLNDLEVVVTAGFPVLRRSTGTWEDQNLIPGEWIFVGGDSAATRFGVAANNGPKRIREINGQDLILDKTDSEMVVDVAEPGEATTIQVFYGHVIKNELGADIVRQTYQFERSMGAPDTSDTLAVQAEYIKGAFPNELEMTVDTADKIVVNYSFVAIGMDTTTASEGRKPGDRRVVEEGDAYNTSVDFSRMRLALVVDGNSAPEDLFAFITDTTLSINNNVSLNKAVGYLGGFDATLGVFEVSAEINAYFTRIESVRAVQQNKDVTFDWFATRQNSGFVVDMPLVALGGGMSEVEIDEPIMIPLDSQAASAAKLGAGFDYTLMWVMFDYLPDLAANLVVED